MRSSWVGTAVRPGANADADADDSAISKHRSALLVPRLMPILLACLFDKVQQNCIGGKEASMAILNLSGGLLLRRVRISCAAFR